jgi:hypothetical protein|tara:strand:- start:160 stop:396 length:237 start_codon:yes stop_codon:yes gene_type:complete
MNYSNRKWVILNVSDITDEMIASAIQTSMDTLRKTLDGTQAILKWDGDTPTCFDGMTTYNHSEILTELAKSTWTEADA